MTRRPSENAVGSLSTLRRRGITRRMQIKKFFRDRWEDIRSHLIWQILIWTFGGGLVAAIVQAVRSARQLPFEWWFVGVVFLVSGLALAVITLLAGQKRVSQQSTIPTSPLLPVQPTL